MVFGRRLQTSDLCQMHQRALAIEHCYTRPEFLIGQGYGEAGIGKPIGKPGRRGRIERRLDIKFGADRGA